MNLAKKTRQQIFRNKHLLILLLLAIAYVKQKRLESAHRTLLAADPLTTSVTEVATQWGFFHLGRLARDYCQLFGELPSETLKR